MLERDERLCRTVQFAERRAEVTPGRENPGIGRSAAARNERAASSILSSRSHTLPRSKCAAAQSGASVMASSEVARRALQIVHFLTHAGGGDQCRRTAAVRQPFEREPQSRGRVGRAERARERAGHRLGRLGRRLESPSRRRTQSVPPPARRCPGAAGCPRHGGGRWRDRRWRPATPRRASRARASTR